MLFLLLIVLYVNTFIIYRLVKCAASYAGFISLYNVVLVCTYKM